MWMVKNGLENHTCINQNVNASGLWCKTLHIPECVDRTINCTDFVYPEETNVDFLTLPDEHNRRMAETKINFRCKEAYQGFDFKTGQGFISFAREPLITSLTILCTNDRYTYSINFNQVPKNTQMATFIIFQLLGSFRWSNKTDLQHGTRCVWKILNLQRNFHTWLPWQKSLLLWSSRGNSRWKDQTWIWSNKEIPFIRW